MATAPTDEEVTEYLGPNHSYSAEDISEALAAETAAQAHVCRIPADEDPYPADLVSALYRRVARHLEMKSKPLGYEPGLDGGISYISANDSEIRRLEAPYRKLPVR